jgi:hypothetical protein
VACSDRSGTTNGGLQACGDGTRITTHEIQVWSHYIRTTVCEIVVRSHYALQALSFGPPAVGLGPAAILPGPPGMESGVCIIFCQYLHSRPRGLQSSYLNHQAALELRPTQAMPLTSLNTTFIRIINLIISYHIFIIVLFLLCLNFTFYRLQHVDSKLVYPRGQIPQHILKKNLPPCT